MKRKKSERPLDLEIDASWSKPPPPPSKPPPALKVDREKLLSKLRELPAYKQKLVIKRPV